MNTLIYNILIYNILSCIQSVFNVYSNSFLMNTVRGVFKRIQLEYSLNTDNYLKIKIITKGVFNVFNI